MTIELLTLILVVCTMIGVGYLVARQPRRSLRNGAGSVLVDTSVLMDGRIIAIATSGFITSTLVIPRSVIGELQFLADNADNDKRARARQGLDVVRELQDMQNVSVQLLQDGSKAAEGVDERLLSLAKSSSAAICTIDYNLNKVAAVEGIRVLNVNELARGLRMAYLPGERIMLELTQKGSDSHQAVGHLPDGTMVVVEHANQHVGKRVEIEFIRGLQTAAGRMMFARRVDRDQPMPKNRPAGRTPAARSNTTPTPKTVVVPASSSPRPARQSRPAQQATKQPAAAAPANTQTSQPRQRAAQQSKAGSGQHARRRQQPRQRDQESALIELVNNQ